MRQIKKINESNENVELITQAMVTLILNYLEKKINTLVMVHRICKLDKNYIGTHEKQNDYYLLFFLIALSKVFAFPVSAVYNTCH